MINNVKRFHQLHLAAFFGIVGFMSLDIHLTGMLELLLPTLLLIILLYFTSYLINCIMGEVCPLFSLVIYGNNGLANLNKIGTSTSIQAFVVDNIRVFVTGNIFKVSFIIPH
jgi:hypothetical protein